METGDSVFSGCREIVREVWSRNRTIRLLVVDTFPLKKEREREREFSIKNVHGMKISGIFFLLTRI
jgi:hypothetical protein